jgi:hypothetical protein
MKRLSFRAIALSALVATGGCSSQLDCAQADQEAQALIAENSRCAEGDRCRVVDVVMAFAKMQKQACIQPLLCSVALREDASEGAFLERAVGIVDRRSCHSCAVAKCRPAETLEAFCDTATHTCQLRPR